MQTRNPRTGRLRSDGYTELILRASLLIDLALDGRIERGATLRIDCGPTGFAPADLLLSAIERRPDRDLGWWIEKGPRLRQPLANEWVEAGRWKGRWPHHYADLVDPGGQEWQARRDRLNQVIAGAQPASVQEAVLAAMVRIARLGELNPPSLRGGYPPIC